MVYDPRGHTVGHTGRVSALDGGPSRIYLLHRVSPGIFIVLIRSRYINDGPLPAGENNNIQRSAADFAVFDVSLLLHGTVDQ